jgi:hypothetical protein
MQSSPRCPTPSGEQDQCRLVSGTAISGVLYSNVVGLADVFFFFSLAALSIYSAIWPVLIAGTVLMSTIASYTALADQIMVSRSTQGLT